MEWILEANVLCKYVFITQHLVFNDTSKTDILKPCDEFQDSQLKLGDRSLLKWMTIRCLFSLPKGVRSLTKISLINSRPRGADAFAKKSIVAQEFHGAEDHPQGAAPQRQIRESTSSMTTSQTTTVKPDFYSSTS